MAGASWTSIKISKDTYERMKVLSEATGLSMDSIIREFLSYPDSVVPSEMLYLSSVKEFYAFLRGGRENMQKQGWTKTENIERKKAEEESKNG